jgi:hypothetical protein
MGKREKRGTCGKSFSALGSISRSKPKNRCQILYNFADFLQHDALSCLGISFPLELKDGN